MEDLRYETLENLVASFLNAAAQLNGNGGYGGRGNENKMSATMLELAARFRQNNAIENDPAVKPLLDVLKVQTDLSDMCALAQAVKSLPVPVYTRVKNPFSIPNKP